MIADLDTLLTALYVELTDQITPSLGFTRQMLTDQPTNRPAPGTAIVTDKGLAGEDIEEFFASPQLGLELIHPARKDEHEARSFPNWLRQRVEAIIWTLKDSSGSTSPRSACTPRSPGTPCWSWLPWPSAPSPRPCSAAAPAPRHPPPSAWTRHRPPIQG